MTTQTEKKTEDRFAWSVADWANAAGISRASVYNILSEGKIESVKYGGKRLIVTHPKAWIESLKAAA